MNLNPVTFKPFPISAIKPRGWLAQQLRIQADGLSGHLDQFWPDIQNSAWIGGHAEGWERMPYWLDGVIPLAWLLDDSNLKSRITGYLDYILTHQHKDGWLGPKVEQKQEAADVWSQALALKMLLVYHDATSDERIPCAVEKALKMLDRYIDHNPLSNWGQFRWFEFLISIWWLYERAEESWLLDLAGKIHAQGFDWKAFFQRWPLKEPTEKGRWNYAGHVVNNAMALKAGALWWRLSGEASDRDTVHTMLENLDRYHGMPTGVFTGDECLAGTSAIQGTELCAVVELMYSLECLLSVFGEPSFADRLETIAYNALPATLSPDMWSHQYDQQLNQIECSVRENRCWTTNNSDSNIFGLEPNFGCCTANFSQGWPNFTSHLWIQTAEGGIAAVAYAPSQIETKLQGVPISIQLNTEYPFRQDLHFQVQTEQPIQFPLLLRIPAWAEGAWIEMDGQRIEIDQCGGFYKIERTWQEQTHFILHLPMIPKLVSRPGNAVSISRGPLVFAYWPGEDWQRINVDKPLRDLPHSDWEVYSTTPWNYALQMNAEAINESIQFEEHPLCNPVFSPTTPSVIAKVRGRRLPQWTQQNGSADLTPPSPVSCSEPVESLQLIPYGCTNLRIAEFPVLK